MGAALAATPSLEAPPDGLEPSDGRPHKGGGALPSYGCTSFPAGAPMEGP